METERPSVRNMPFFEAVAATQEASPSPERTALAQEYLAALLILRLFTDWADCPGVLQSAPDVRARFRGAVAQIPDYEAKQLLGTVVSEIYKATKALDVVAAPLAAYAWLLEERDRHDLAEDVLRTVADGFEMQGSSVHDSINYPFIASVHRRLGDHALRRRQLDEAERHYQRQYDIAVAAGNQTMVFDARTCAAMVENIRGNLQISAQALAQIIDETQRANDARAEAYARRVRGSVVKRLGNPVDAIQDFYAAYLISVDTIQREWLLHDIAVAGTDLGLLDMAHLVYTILVQTSPNPALRSLALVNLLELAVLRDEPDEFAAIEQQLTSYHLLREKHFYARMYRAQADAQWRGREAGIAAYQSVAEEALALGFHEFEFRALSAMEALQRQPAARATNGAKDMVLPGDAGTPNPEALHRMVEAIEAACRQRLQAAELSS